MIPIELNMIPMELNLALIEYIQSSLAAGNKLAELLLPLKLSEGHTFLSIQNKQNYVFSNKFEYAHPISLAETNSLMTEYIYTHLLQNPNDYVVFEAIESIGDPVLQKYINRSPNYFSFEQEIYYFITSNDTQEYIMSALESARFYPFVGVISSTSYKLFHQAAVELDVLDELASNVKSLLIGIYDEDGRLIWIK